MDAVFIASNEADARAAEVVADRRAQISGALAVKLEGIISGVRTAQSPDADARSSAVRWCRSVLVPQALDEQATLYGAAAEAPGARLLVEAMVSERQWMLGLIDDLENAADPFGAALAAHALRVLFASHVAKEDAQILPLLLGSADVSVAALVRDTPGSAAEPEESSAGGGCGSSEHSCQCNESESSSLPELDAREIPHAIRHATIFGALDGLAPGQGLVLVAPHDPLPLLAQLEARSPGAFVVDYLQSGPEAWRLSMIRSADVGRDS